MSDLANTPVAALLELAASQLEVAAHTTDAQVETLASSIAALVALGARAAGGERRRRVARRTGAQDRRAGAARAGGDAVPRPARAAHGARARCAERAPRGAEWRARAEVDWATVLAGIRFRYTMEDERQLFDRIIGAAACPDVNVHDTAHDSLRGSVELF